MVWNQHRFMVGDVDYTDDHFALPLYWLVVARSLGRRRRAGDAAAMAGCRYS